MTTQIGRLRAEIALLRRTPMEFLRFYQNNGIITDNIEQMTSSQLMGLLRTMITNIREECYNANMRYETVLGLEHSGKNEERNLQNWNRIVTEFKDNSQRILEMLGTTVADDFLLELSDPNLLILDHNDVVFQSRWNQIRVRVREIVLKILTTKRILSEIVGKPMNNMSSNELLEEIIGHLKFTNDQYNKITDNMIPLTGLRIIENNEEKLLQIVLYIQQLEPRVQKTEELTIQLGTLEGSIADIKEWMIETIQEHNPMFVIGIDIDEIQLKDLLNEMKNIIKGLEKRPTQNQLQTLIQQNNDLQREVILWRNLALYLSVLKADCTNHIALPYWE